MTETAIREAAAFVENETQFHLGFLPTEQSHPKTMRFSETIMTSTTEGAAMLLSVDNDIVPVAERILVSAEFVRLEERIVDAIQSGSRILFSGCGATGRLAIILEKIWRACWEDVAEQEPSRGAVFRSWADASYSIMTGGDRALIRSVENFEDYQSFGRRQVLEAKVTRGDVFIAISEGGETSSVIGTALEARERGADVFFIFNNPASILVDHIERSRKLIETPGVTVIDLHTGPMALSGSTRLQATTSELLVVGAALEGAIAALKRSHGIDAQQVSAVEYAKVSESLVSQLSTGDALAGIASFIEFETEIYLRGALVTYVADDPLLDIISDTTERTPTFMLPPFRKMKDSAQEPSWAFTKDPFRRTEQAWRSMLRREPRGLAWTAADYRAMGGAERMISSPPVLDRAEILSFEIGNEPDASRWERPGSALLTVDVLRGEPATGRGSVGDTEVTTSSFVQDLRAAGVRVASLQIGSPDAIARCRPAGAGEIIAIPISVPNGSVGLFYHIAEKLVLNTMSTGTMGKMGRIVGNWMIQVDPTNKKLVDRSTRIVSELAGIPYDQACRELHETIVTRRADPRRYHSSVVVDTLNRLGVTSP